MTTYDERVQGERVMMNDFTTLATKIKDMMPQVMDPLEEVLDFENYERTLSIDDFINVAQAHAYTQLASNHIKTALVLIKATETFNIIDPAYEQALADGELAPPVPGDGAPPTTNKEST